MKQKSEMRDQFAVEKRVRCHSRFADDASCDDNGNILTHISIHMLENYVNGRDYCSKTEFLYKFSISK